MALTFKWGEPGGTITFKDGTVLPWYEDYSLSLKDIICIVSKK